MKRVVSGCLAAAWALLWSSSAAAQFSYDPVGQLHPGSGSGAADATVYVPNMRFPMESAPAFANSQVWGHGGSQGPSGGQCHQNNFSFPWKDNYCESRSWTMPLCPSGTGHQGQDIRAATCDKNVHWVVAGFDGQITNVGSYSVYLTRSDGTRLRYLHMGSVQVSTGQTITKGQRLGKVSNAFGGTPTTVHLHFDINQNVSGHGKVYVSPYMTLVRAYEELIGEAGPNLDAKVIRAEADLVADETGQADYKACTGQAFTMTYEVENAGKLTWTDTMPGSNPGEMIRLGVPTDTPDPFTGETRISVNATANASVDPSGGECSNATGCKRVAFTGSGMAPLMPGTVTSTWQMVDETREWFGPEMSLSVRVADCKPPGSGGNGGTGQGGTGTAGTTGGGNGGGVGVGGAGVGGAGTGGPGAGGNNVGPGQQTTVTNSGDDGGCSVAIPESNRASGWWRLFVGSDR